MTPDEQLDHSTISRGKYRVRDLTPSEIAETDPAYLVWAFEAWDQKPCSLLLYHECQKDVAEERNRTGACRAKESE